MANKEKIVRAELDQWLREGLIDASLHQSLAARYEERGWDIAGFLLFLFVFGAAVFFLGIVVLAVDLVSRVPELAIAIGTSALSIGAYYGGFKLSRNKRGGLLFTGRALRLVACLVAAVAVAFIGRVAGAPSEQLWNILPVMAFLYFVVTFASGDAIVAALMVLTVLSWSVTWGKDTYFLALYAPARVAILSSIIVAMGYMQERHLVPKFKRFQGFDRAFYLFGGIGALGAFLVLVFTGNRAFWLWPPDLTEKFLLALLSGAASGAFILIGLRKRDNLFTYLGAVYLAINIYARYFEYLWDRLHKAAFFLALGASLLVAGFIIERGLRSRARSKHPAILDDSTSEA